MTPADFVTTHIPTLATERMRTRASEPNVRAALVAHATRTLANVPAISGLVWAVYMAPKVIKGVK